MRRLVVILFLPALLGCQDPPQSAPVGRRLMERSHPGMGAEAHLSVWTNDEPAAVAAFDEVFAELDRLESLMSVWRPGSDIVRLIVGGGMKYAAAGMTVGVVTALALGQFVESMLFEVSTRDLVSHAGTAALLLSVAVLACYVPARRAMRVDPIVTLQSE